MNRMVQLGWKERIIGGRVVWIPPSKVKRKKKAFSMSDFRSKQRVPSHVDDVEAVIVDETFSSKCPALFEFLTVLPDDAPKSAKTASLTLFTEDGLFKICLSDRVTGLVCFVSGETYQETLMGLEAGLSNGTVDWRSPRRNRK